MYYESIQFTTQTPDYVNIEKLQTSERDPVQSHIHKELLRQQRNLRLNLISEKDFSLIRESLYNQGSTRGTSTDDVVQRKRTHHTSDRGKHS